MSAEELRSQRCKPCKGEAHRLAPDERDRLLATLDGWTLAEDGAALRREFRFNGFLPVLSFVNAIGWMAEQENHHPDLELGWGYCRVRYSTHDVGGLSRNDFICAAKVDALVCDR